MTYAPKSISELGAYWVSQGGVNLGIVGNRAHTKGYHLGLDRIYDGADGPGLGDKDYSVQLARDKAGLTNAASAIDLGRLDGTLPHLREFSTWLVGRCKAKAAGTRDVREVIWSPDGVKVQRWSGEDNAVHSGPGNGDSSHLTHTHISFYRDSEGRDKVGLFAPYPAFTPPDTSTGDAVKSFAVPEVRTLAAVKNLAWLHVDSSLAPDPANVQVSPGRELVLVGVYSAGVSIIAYEPAAGDTGSTSRAMFIAAADIASVRPAPSLTQADLDKARSAGFAEAKVKAAAAVAAI